MADEVLRDWSSKDDWRHEACLELILERTDRLFTSKSFRPSSGFSKHKVEVWEEIRRRFVEAHGEDPIPGTSTPAFRNNVMRKHNRILIMAEARRRAGMEPTRLELLTFQLEAARGRSPVGRGVGAGEGCGWVGAVYEWRERLFPVGEETVGAWVEVAWGCAQELGFDPADLHPDGLHAAYQTLAHSVLSAIPLKNVDVDGLTEVELLVIKIETFRQSLTQ